MKTSKGLKSIEVADVPETGLPAESAWVQVKGTQIDSAGVTEAEPTTEPVFIEEEDDPIENLVTERGSKSFAAVIYDVSVDTLNLLKGGTVSAATETQGKTWREGESITIEKALRVTSKTGFRFIIPRGTVVALMSMAFARSGMATVSLTVTALKPKDPDLRAVEWAEPLAS